jgi:hypothetical protein
MTIQPYSPLKIPTDFLRKSKSHSLTGSLRTPGLPAASAGHRRTERFSIGDTASMVDAIMAIVVLS